MLSIRNSKSPASRAIVVPLMQDGQPDSLEIARVNFAAQDLPASVFSQESSAVSSASFPLARLAWHLKMHALSLSAAFAAPASHFAVGLLAGGMRPVSSPPHGVPDGGRVVVVVPIAARADPTHRPTDSAAMTDTVRNMRDLLSSRARSSPALGLTLSLNGSTRPGGPVKA